ncbi:hypothetical protein [Streptomyces sp. CBMA29]|uniref:hypothetical protein n=1 Tax=Streptomyces sp. CBMA29 TaxID=1896314 RepID=UPI0016621821|nr:hypothetical protein [Streptomyces sp. CBMA29]MBD0736189.1 hypothetical protein [Streptomyces sp. CBMA29]
MPHNTNSPPTISDQADALRAMLRLAEQYPDLPAPYIACGRHEFDRIRAQLDSPSTLETWREALHAPAESVEFNDLHGDVQLQFTADIDRVTFRFYVIFPYGDAVSEAAV